MKIIIIISGLLLSTTSFADFLQEFPRNSYVTIKEDIRLAPKTMGQNNYELEILNDGTGIVRRACALSTLSDPASVPDIQKGSTFWISTEAYQLYQGYIMENLYLGTHKSPKLYNIYCVLGVEAVNVASDIKLKLQKYMEFHEKPYTKLENNSATNELELGAQEAK